MKTVKALLVMIAFIGFGVGVSAQGMQGMHTQKDNTGKTGGPGGMMGMMQQMHGGGMMGGMMHGGQGMMGQSVPSVKSILAQAKTLDLTGEQVQTLKGQATDLQKQVIRLRADAKIAGIDFTQTLNNENINQGDAEKALENRYVKNLDIQKALLESYFTGLDVLTDEQRSQVSTLGGGCMMMQGMHGQSGRDSGPRTDMDGMMQPDAGDME